MSIADDIRKAIAAIPTTYQPTPRPAIHPRDVSLYKWLYGGQVGPMPGPDPLPSVVVAQDRLNGQRAHQSVLDEVSRVTGIPVERIHISENLPPGVDALIGSFGLGAQVWEPSPVKWPRRPLLIDNVIRAAVAGRRRIGHHRAQAVRRLLSRPLFRGPSPHFTVLEDGTVLDHTAWLGHRDVWTESQIERDRRFSAEARMYVRALLAVQMQPGPTLKVNAL